jgi:integrating conjugative element protein (TIGR03759 family)
MLSIRILPVAIAGCVVLLFGLGVADAGSENTLISNTATSEVDLSELNMTRANAWGLSLQDYEKSLTLREGVGSYWDASTDPITMLGIHAKTANKRRFYAEKLARFEYKMYGKLQAFENAHGEAWQKLYPKAAKFDFTESRKARSFHENDIFPVSDDALPVQQSDFIPDIGRLAYFVTIPCQCELTVAQLIRGALNKPVDIYIMNAKDDKQIQLWAMQMQIPVELVQRSAITLNHDNGLHLKAGFFDLPVLTERTEKGYVRINKKVQEQNAGWHLVEDGITDDEGWQ